MLYLEHFGLDEPPFRITPHTDFFFDGADRGATLEALLYAILHDEGIVKVSGEVGSGKTMLCRVLMERLPEHVEIVYLANPAMAQDDILYAIADDLRVEFAEGERLSVMLNSLLNCLIDLYAGGRRVVLLVDEAHAMPEATLEQVRLLSNLESSRHKLLQIVLFGQPELDLVLDKISMRQLKDRITHSFRMRPLSEAEIGKYLSFRMRAAGYRGPDVFGPRAVAKLAKAADGLTRRVNILADKALLAAFTRNTHGVTVREVRAAIRDSDFGRLLNEKTRNPFLFTAAALITGLALGAAVHWAFTRDPGDAQSFNKSSDRTVTASGKVTMPRSAPSPAVSAVASAPVAVTPVTVTPAAVTPAAVTPAAVTPFAVTPAPVTPVAVSPAAAPPEGINTQLAVRRSAPGDAHTAVPASSGDGKASAPSELAPRPGPAMAPGSLLSPDSSRRMAAYRTGGYKILKQRVVATLELLAKEPGSGFTIELFSTGNSDPARTQRFLLRARDLVRLEDVYVLPQPAGNGYRIRVLFGRFQSRQEAANGADRLPPKYKREFQTVLRSFADIRASL